ncbi:MAG: hypothetical protein ACKOD7_00910 [Polynucleobacter victoriensis]
MLDKTTRKELTTLAKNIAAGKKILDKLETDFHNLRLKAVRTVEATQVGKTVTLTSGNRIIKAKKPAGYNDRYDIMENGKLIAKEYFGNIHDIRYAIAMGKL